MNSATTSGAKAETDIRALFDAFLSAIRHQQMDKIMSFYHPVIVAFDAVAQLQFKGIKAYGDHWRKCMEMCPGATIFEMQDLDIAATDTLAFAHWLLRCGAADQEGNEQTSWMRVTTGLRKIDGTWCIVHEHFSVPFDMESGKALFGLEP